MLLKSAFNLRTSRHMLTVFCFNPGSSFLTNNPEFGVKKHMKGGGKEGSVMDLGIVGSNRNGWWKPFLKSLGPLLSFVCKRRTWLQSCDSNQSVGTQGLSSNVAR